jgi:cytoskeleton protein RodZ
LQAIEDGRSDDLPGSTYAVGFVRGYADYLGLDSKEIVRRFRQENGEFTNRAELVFPSAVSEGSIPTGALLALVILVAAGIYGAWYWYQSREPSLASAVPALPERLAALIHQPVGSGSELVPVDGAKSVDSSKVNEVPQPPVAVPAPAAIATYPTVPLSPTSPIPSVPPSSSSTQAPTPSSASVNPASPHEDVVPPAEDDVPPPAATPAQQPSAASVEGNTGGEVKALDIKPDDNKSVRDTKGKAKGKEPKGDQVKAPVVPADAAVTPVAPSDADAKPVEHLSNGDVKPADGSVGDKPSSRVVLRAEEDCWIEIRDGKGKVVLNRLLKKGEVYSAPSRRGYTMTVGNAGALSMQVDGKTSGSLGRAGMVRRAVPLDAERLKDGVPPMPEPSAPEASPSESSVPPPASGVPATE